MIDCRKYVVHLQLVHATYCCYWRCPVPSCPSWFSSELNGKDHIEGTHGFREGRCLSFYECLRRCGLEWFANRTFFDQNKFTGQSLWMDLPLARISCQELRNSYTITGSPEFAPLKKFFRGATHQLECLYTDNPDLQCSQGRMISLCDQICTDIESHTDVITPSTASTPRNISPNVSHTTSDEPPTYEATTLNMYMPTPLTMSDRPITDRQDQPYTTCGPWNVDISPATSPTIYVLVRPLTPANQNLHRSTLSGLAPQCLACPSLVWICCHTWSLYRWTTSYYMRRARSVSGHLLTTASCLRWHTGMFMLPVIMWLRCPDISIFIRLSCPPVLAPWITPCH